MLKLKIKRLKSAHNFIDENVNSTKVNISNAFDPSMSTQDINEDGVITDDQLVHSIDYKN